MVKDLKLGIIGFSSGNGHPFSFSAIINGFDENIEYWKDWEGIRNYLMKQDSCDMGIPNVKVTNIWTQNKELSHQISKASKIDSVEDNFIDMVDKVDGVIIARDDYQSHIDYAKPFLESNKYVFIDKPLSLNKDELEYFRQYIDDGKLMSCSGLRYARELDEAREILKNDSSLKHISAHVINDWQKYGVHLLDGIFGVVNVEIMSVWATRKSATTVVLTTTCGKTINITCLEKAVKTFSFEFWTETNRIQAEMNDNFSAFRRTMHHFVNMMNSGEMPMSSNDVMKIMRILMCAEESIAQGKEIEYGKDFV